LEANNVQEVSFDGLRIKGRLRSSISITIRDTPVDVDNFYLYLPFPMEQLPDKIRAQSSDQYPILIDTEEPRRDWWSTLIYWAPFCSWSSCGSSSSARCKAGATAPSASARAARSCGRRQAARHLPDVAGADEAKSS